MKITMSKNQIFIEGHAEYADPGEDIVCAGVSAIFQTAQLGLLEMSKIYPEYIKIEMIEGGQID